MLYAMLLTSANNAATVLAKNLGSLITKKKKNQYLVGFALETENEIENAKTKLIKKNLDAVVLNSLNDSGTGFGKTTNKITFILLMSIAIHIHIYVCVLFRIITRLVT